MYLDHTFARKTFAQRIGSAKVKSKSEVTHSRTILEGHGVADMGRGMSARTVVR